VKCSTIPSADVCLKNRLLDIEAWISPAKWADEK